ncbi:hypothetical protein STENM327S_05736 [Streptomyces tendae]
MLRFDFAADGRITGIERHRGTGRLEAANADMGVAACPVAL